MNADLRSMKRLSSLLLWREVGYDIDPILQRLFREQLWSHA